MVDKLVLLSNLVVGAYLTGLIWTIQVVHYPLFEMADRTNFAAFEAAHSFRISGIVLVPMVLELGLSGVFLGLSFKQMPLWLPWVCAFLVGVVWLSTFFLQVPQHSILSAGFNPQAHQILVSSNWIRTIAWSVKTLLLSWVVYQVLMG